LSGDGATRDDGLQTGGSTLAFDRRDAAWRLPDFRRRTGNRREQHDHVTRLTSDSPTAEGSCFSLQEGFDPGQRLKGAVRNLGAPSDDSIVQLDKGMVRFTGLPSELSSKGHAPLSNCTSNRSPSTPECMKACLNTLAGWFLDAVAEICKGLRF
jgi:hypothetical protein